MIILTTLSYVGAVVGFVGAVLSIASALYYVSEFVEEHSGFARRCIDRFIYAVWALLFLEWAIDRQPFYLCLLGAASHYVYRTNLETFPVIRLASGRFVLAVLLTVVNHWLWFRHFSDLQHARRDQMTYGGRYGGGGSHDVTTPEVAFGQVASFFLFCVWLVPFALFVSLSAGDLVLPTSTDPGTDTDTGRSARKAGGILKQSYKVVGAYVDPILLKLGVTKGGDDLPGQRYA